MQPYDEGVQDILRSYDAQIIERGREYAEEGRVKQLHRDGHGVTAFVRGEQNYHVLLGIRRNGAGMFAQCNCPAYERERQCKHLAALAWTLSTDPRSGGSASAAGQARAPEPLPVLFRSVYSSVSFFSRLSLYAGETLVQEGEHGLRNRHDDRWSPLKDWWWRSTNPPSQRSGELRQLLLKHTPEIQDFLKVLREWKPRPLPSKERTGYEDLYAELARLYEDRRERANIVGALPGPPDKRHPGFDFAFDPKRRVFEATERPSKFLGGASAPMRLAVSAILEPDEPLRFEGHAFTNYGGCDAWELFALRAMLSALHEKKEEAVKLLAGDLGRPLWDRVLENLAPRAPRAVEPREWTFCLSPTFRDLEYKLVPFARPIRESGKTIKWKKQTFETLLLEAAAPGESRTADPYLRETSRVEHEIARLALCTLEPPHNNAKLNVGTPLGYELAKLLAQHPRTLVSSEQSKPNPESDPAADFFVGPLTMNLQRREGGVLEPRFCVDDRELPVRTTTLAGMKDSMFRGAGNIHLHPTAIVAVQIPPQLQPWLDAVGRMREALAFPPESVERLATATQSLTAAGIAVLPREALGEEVPYNPAAAIRVQWQAGPASSDADIELLITVHPDAPLALPGMGGRLFTFHVGDKRVFVERDFKRELELMREARALFEAPVTWEGFVGNTQGIEDTLVLAAFLDRNPQGWAIEVKVGRPPVVAQWSKSGKLVARKIGNWLVVDGALEIDGVKLTIGDILEAARHAERYVRAGNGLFLELSQDAIAKLQPIAMAAELAPTAASLGETGEGEQGVVLHDAFGSILAQATDLFASVGGVDLAAYAARFEKRDRKVRIAPLEHGKLRPYQRDGVEWMLRLATWAPGCVLADDMGLGKTIQTAAVLKARAKLGPALIIAPASVSSNWVSELARFMPSLSVRWYNEDREMSLAELGAGDVLIVSYGLIQREKVEFGSLTWSTVVVDEAQYIKNSGAQRTDAVRSLKRDFTIALTGTPLENHLGELYSIVDIAFPSLLGDEQKFRERFRRPIEVQRDAERLKALGQFIGPFLLRRTRGAVLQELPAREDITEHVELSAEERKRYLALRTACEKAFADRKDRDTAGALRIELLTALMRLRQIACDVRLVDPTYTGPSTKIARAVDLVQQLAAEGNRALVFSQFTQFLDKVRDAFEAVGLKVAYLTGETPTTKRRAIIDAFQAGEYDVFCVSLLAGGTGLNLTKASYVIHLDPWWNPAAEEQATSRAHRMGQTEPVTVYRLVARGTIEEAVLEMHAEKRELASAVLEGKGNPKVLSSKELLDLLRFGSSSG